MNDMSHSPTGGQTNLAKAVSELMAGLLKWQDHIEKSMARVNNMYSFNDVVMSVLQQQRHFYEFEDCYIIMEFCVFPQWNAYHCFCAGGTTEAILRAEPRIREVAEQLGCKYMSISGRTGWSRRLKDHGWKHKMSTLYKEV